MARVVDCLQLDVTRCGGYTGWLLCAEAARRHGRDVSAHCAPALHAPLAGAVPHLRHVEWFTDHVRVDAELVDDPPAVGHGRLTPHHGRPGHGMQLRSDAESYLAAQTGPIAADDFDRTVHA